jgi:peptidoglycan/xylan/chitin deacetylase (PgdA/CDA1 family)
VISRWRRQVVCLSFDTDAKRRSCATATRHRQRCRRQTRRPAATHSRDARQASGDVLHDHGCHAASRWSRPSRADAMKWVCTAFMSCRPPDRAEERLDQAIRISEATGTKPLGYRAPSWAFSGATLDRSSGASCRQQCRPR